MSLLSWEQLRKLASWRAAKQTGRGLLFKFVIIFIIIYYPDDAVASGMLDQPSGT